MTGTPEPQDTAFDRFRIWLIKQIKGFLRLLPWILLILILVKFSANVREGMVPHDAFAHLLTPYADLTWLADLLGGIGDGFNKFVSFWTTPAARHP